MNTLIQLESMGYIFTVEGDKIRYIYTGNSPDPALVRPLLAELKEHKGEAIQFLQNLSLFFDGANGGYGWHINRGNLIIQEGYGLVEGTSNMAEYNALIEGLKAVSNLPFLSLIVKGDSQLVINQITGQWQIKNDGLRSLHQQASDLIHMLTHRGVNVTFQWIPREQNKQADKLSRKALTDAPGSDSLHAKCQQTSYPITFDFVDGRVTYHHADEAYQDLWARSMLKEVQALGGVVNDQIYE